MQGRGGQRPMGPASFHHPGNYLADQIGFVEQRPPQYFSGIRRDDEELLLLERRLSGYHVQPLGPSIAIPPPPPSEEDDSSIGERPQNFIRDHEPHLRFTEYPKLEKLIRLKDELNKQRAHPPVHIQADLRKFDWSSLETNFDVILVDPPWREYTERLASAGGVVTEDLTPWTLSEILTYIKVDKIAETHSFCFVWCGSQHLDDGRQLLQSWGFRRCEDICWLKTNKIAIERAGRMMPMDESGLFQHTKEHCLMGVKGVVRRSQDSHFIHSNIDTDLIVEEEPVDSDGRPTASTAKPTELYDIIERFCLGRKRLEIFGLDRNIRRGWLTIGKEISVSNFQPDRYLSWVSDSNSPQNESELNRLVKGGQGKEIHRGRYIGSTTEIEQLRPKSPPRSTAPSRSTLGS